MLDITNSTKFKKDFKKFKHKESVKEELSIVLKSLQKQKPLEEKYFDHNLVGSWAGHREYHIKPDVLLIYRTNATTLFLERLGSHSELF